MKLELNQVIPYSGYGLKGYFNGKLDIVTEICFEHGIISSLNHGNVLLKDFKPIFKPLSDYKDVNSKAMNNLNCDLQTQIELTSYANGYILLHSISYGLYIIMCRNHIDFNRLIPEGLAVNMNE